MKHVPIRDGIENFLKNGELEVSTKSYLKKSKHSFPTCNVYLNSAFLPSKCFCHVFVFKIPDLDNLYHENGEFNYSNEKTFTILGRPSSSNSRDNNFLSTYESYMDFRGNDLIQPFVAIDDLFFLGGVIPDLHDGKDLNAFEVISGTTLAERINSINHIYQELKKNEQQFLYNARLYGIVNQIDKAARLMKNAYYDYEANEVNLMHINKGI